MYGGTGKVMNYDLIPKEGIKKTIFIAGGLHSKNIKEITKKFIHTGSTFPVESKRMDTKI